MTGIRKKLLRKLRSSKTIDRFLGRDMDRYLNYVTGLVHIGANSGQECAIYDGYGLNVVWVEPIPRIFEQLQKNISRYDKQRAFQELITDTDNIEYKLHIANNNGASSSIYDFKDHKDMWPDIDYEDSILLKSRTLSSLFKIELLDISKYQALVVDTQGSELLVLKGSLPLLSYFKYIKVEVADFESYEGCCTLSEMELFMQENGYVEFARKKYAKNDKGGRYYDLIYKREGF